MNEIDLDRLDALERAATPAPWDRASRRDETWCVTSEMIGDEDAEFVEVLRNAYPELSTRIRELTEYTHRLELRNAEMESEIARLTDLLERQRIRHADEGRTWEQAHPVSVPPSIEK